MGIRPNRAVNGVACVAAAALVAGLCPGGEPAPAAQSAPEAEAKRPAVAVHEVVTGLDIPWDLTFLPSGAMLFTERDRERIWWRASNGRKRVVAAEPRGVWHGGETGLMAIEAAPGFRKNRLFYTCHGYRDNGVRDVRVALWRLNPRATRAKRLRPIVTGLPSTSGRHGGCQLAFGRGGRLYVGTGDAATGRNPQRLTSGGGKVLRVHAGTGRGVRANPFGRAPQPMKRRVFSYGHRNVQGLAPRPGGGMWAVEHGSDRDDEVNRLHKRGNYGWNPVPGYDESVPMTDHSLPGRQIAARWRSGRPTIAPSGAAWLTGRRWGAWRGRLAMPALAGEHLRVLQFDRRGEHVGGVVPPRLRGRHGRLRAAVLGPDNALYVTTSDGDGQDTILRITPRP